MTLNRKQELLTLLKQSKEAINGQSLAEHFGVTRQIIVQDIALLRADGSRHFLEQAASSDFRPLSELTNGVHYHLVEADSQQDLDYIEEALDNLGFLVKD